MTVSVTLLESIVISLKWSVYKHYAHVWFPHGQKRAFDILKLECQFLKSHHVGTKSRTQGPLQEQQVS